MWSFKHIIFRDTGRGSRLHFPNCNVSMDDRTGAKYKQCDLRAVAILRVGTSNVLICGFGKRHGLG